ncbi:MAG: hypothetical protein ABIF88_01580 [archaeon]
MEYNGCRSDGGISLPRGQTDEEIATMTDSERVRVLSWGIEAHQGLKSEIALESMEIYLGKIHAGLEDSELRKEYSGRLENLKDVAPLI